MLVQVDEPHIAKHCQDQLAAAVRKAEMNNIARRHDLQEQERRHKQRMRILEMEYELQDEVQTLVLEVYRTVVFHDSRSRALA